MWWSATTSPMARAAPARRPSSRRLVASSGLASAWLGAGGQWRSDLLLEQSARASPQGRAGSRGRAARLLVARARSRRARRRQREKSRLSHRQSSACAGPGHCPRHLRGPRGVQRTPLLRRRLRRPRPTFGGDQPVLEVYLLNFDGDLYGEEIDVEFIEKLRDDATFADGKRSPPRCTTTAAGQRAPHHDRSERPHRPFPSRARSLRRHWMVRGALLEPGGGCGFKRWQ